MPQICRTCLRVDDKSCTFTSLDSVLEPDCHSVKDKLSACVPELALHVVPNPLICSLCMDSLQVTYAFWMRCLETEERIRSVMQSTPLSDLHQVVQLDENVVETKYDAVFNESELSKIQIEPDILDIKDMVPFSSDSVLSCEDAECNGSIKAEPEETEYKCLDTSLKNNSFNQNDEIVEIVRSEETEEKNTSVSGSHECSKCGRCFTRTSSLKRHMSLHSKPKKWKMKLLREPASLVVSSCKQPSSKAKKEEPKPCLVCGETFLTKRNLREHMQVHGQEQSHTCGVCGRHFNFKTNLHRHMLQHAGRRRFKCGTCGKAFARKEHLNKHSVSHSSAMLHQCSLCQKLFKYKDSLRGHLKYHSGEKRFHCELCGNGFIRHDNLQVHLRTVHAEDAYGQHTKRHDDRPHLKCETCGKLCTTKHNLLVHTYTHLTEKPYKCSVCGHTFAQKGSLTLHVRTHTGEKPYICYVCEHRFTQKAELRNHLHQHRSKNGRILKRTSKREAKDI